MGVGEKRCEYGREIEQLLVSLMDMVLLERNKIYWRRIHDVRLIGYSRGSAWNMEHHMIRWGVVCNGGNHDDDFLIDEKT